MRIAIVGAGAVGTLYARRWAAAGHTVTLSFTRDRSQLQQKADALGVAAATPAEAVADADVILFSPPYELITDAARQTGPMVGKIVIDTTNPFTPDRSGLLDLPAGETAFAAVATALPGVRQVKAFHNLAVAQVTDATNMRPVIFVAGDDADARTVVSGLVSDASLIPVETGALETARLSEAPGRLFMSTMDADEADAALQS